jgi:hypothetical protein
VWPLATLLAGRPPALARHEQGQRNGQVPARTPGRVLAFAFVRYGQRRRE